MITTASAGPTGPTVSALLHDDMSAFELGIVTEIFGFPLPGMEAAWYRLAICAERPGPVPILGGATIRADHDLDVFASAQTVIVPGGDARSEPADAVLEALRVARRRGSRIVSICTGTFALAAAGLLNGKRAATHWMLTDLLAERFPLVHVDSSALYVEEDNIFTSAGSASGLDLCLHLVRQDFGPSVANAMARRLVIAPHREGYQPQHIETPVRVDPEDDRVAGSMMWALNNLDQSINVDELAGRAHMSTRSYLRQFSRSTGTSPISWLITQRVQASLPLLENTQLSIEQVAARVGFERAITYRYHFRRIVGKTPTAYRRWCRSETAAAGPRSLEQCRASGD
jgi:AraC family transcriptional regulator, transcriptional activator FtrA